MRKYQFEIELLIYGWVFLNIISLGIRLTEMDCKNRYIDYIAPLSFIHCEIK